MDMHDARTLTTTHEQIKEDAGMQHITDRYAVDATQGGKDAHRITIADALYWWERGLATPVSGDDMYRPKEKDRD